MLAERRREEALAGDNAPEAPPPWSPPQNPEGAPPPPEFEPPRPSDLFPMPAPRVRTASPSPVAVPMAPESQSGPPSQPIRPLSPAGHETQQLQHGVAESRPQDAENPTTSTVDSGAPQSTNTGPPGPPPAENPPAYTS